MAIFSKLWTKLTGADVSRAHTSGFDFGLAFAEYLYEVPTAKRIKRTYPLIAELRKIAEGEITLVETAAEFTVGKTYSDNEKAKTAQVLDSVRVRYKDAARMIVADFDVNFSV